jgi:hypothetical protein
VVLAGDDGRYPDLLNFTAHCISIDLENDGVAERETPILNE